MTPDLFSQQVQRNPYPAYAELRRSAPVHHDPRTNIWFISRHDDVFAALTQPEVFSSRVGPVGMGSTLLGADPPAHTRVRRIVQRSFTLARINALEELIRSRAEELVQRAGRRGRFELVADLAAQIPLAVIARILGVDAARHEDLRRWSDAMLHAHATGIAECRRHLTQTLASGSALLSATDGAEQLGPEELIDVGMLLVIAGIETTTNLIGNALLVLTLQPALQTRLRASPQLVAPFIEEVLRYDAPVQRKLRIATRATDVAGVRIPGGARVEVLLGSANRDEGKFPDAERFLIEREPNRHLAFGAGPHFCLGAQLARLEASAVLEALLRLPPLRRASPDARVEFIPSFSVRGPQRLELAFD